jgi:hypothetical protein
MAVVQQTHQRPLSVLPEQTDNPVAAMVHHQEPTLDQTKQHAPARVQILTLDQIVQHHRHQVSKRHVETRREAVAVK